jgi:hypothetical protein
LSTTPAVAAQTLAQAIDVIEEAYEFMLAYAAQGRLREEDGDGIRERLRRAEAALTVIASTTAEEIGGKEQGVEAAAEFLEVLKQDAARARAAFRFVIAQGGIGSQIIDNLNALTHVRTLLTDLFLLDEALKISGI